MPDDAPAFPELACYLLSGDRIDPRDVVAEAVQAEALGLGTAFVAERWTMSFEAASMCGAATAVTGRLRVGTAATNHNLRHPVVSAGWAATLQRASGGRFVLGIGPGSAAVYRSFGLPPVTTAQMRDWTLLVKRLLSGETVRDHHGPAGDFPLLRIDVPADAVDAPLGLVAFHDEDLALAGELFDEVILHTFLNERALTAAVQTVRRSAEAAGRDPASVRVWSCLVLAGDHMSEERRLTRVVARLGNYLQNWGDELAERNGWDLTELARVRGDRVFASFTGPVESSATMGDLRHLARIIPADWQAIAATGTPAECAARVHREFDSGADGVILHGATPTEIAPVLAPYAQMRRPSLSSA